MKIIVEDKDTKAVKDVVSHHYGVILTDEQAKTLIESDDLLMSEMCSRNSSIDFIIRGMLIKLVINRVMKSSPPPQARGFALTSEWNWPNIDSTPAYTKDFRKLFKEYAVKSGYELNKTWD